MEFSSLIRFGSVQSSWSFCSPWKHLWSYLVGEESEVNAPEAPPPPDLSVCVCRFLDSLCLHTRFAFWPAGQCKSSWVTACEGGIAAPFYSYSPRRPIEMADSRLAWRRLHGAAAELLPVVLLAFFLFAWRWAWSFSSGSWLHLLFPRFEFDPSSVFLRVDDQKFLKYLCKLQNDQNVKKL